GVADAHPDSEAGEKDHRRPLRIEVLERNYQFRRLDQVRHDLTRGPGPVPIRRRSANRVRSPQNRADDLRPSAGHPGDPGDFAVPQSAAPLTGPESFEIFRPAWQFSKGG